MNKKLSLSSAIITIIFFITSCGYTNKINSYRLPSQIPQIVTRNATILDISDFDIHDQITITSIQGIVNKNQPLLYLNTSNSNNWYHGYDGADNIWQNFYNKNYKIEFSTITTLEEAITKYKNYFKGLVVYDDSNEASMAIALTLAGLHNYLVINSTRIGRSYLSNLEIKEDFRGYFANNNDAYDWAITNVLPSCNKTLLYSVGDSITGADYVISNHGFIHNLAYDDATQLSKIDQIHSTLSHPAAIYGWGKSNTSDDFLQEKNYTTKISSLGDFSIAIHNPNLSFHAQVDTSDASISQNRPNYTNTTPENKVYIAFMMPEGDTAKILKNLFAGHWENSYRGQVPINWGISPYIASKFPAIAKYYYDTATYNDYFFTPVSGAGYVWLEHSPNLAQFATHTNTYIRKTDLKIVDCWGDIDNSWDTPTADINTYSQNAPDITAFVATNRNYLSSDIQRVNGNIPVLANGLPYWKFNNAMSEEEIIATISNYTIDNYAQDLAANIKTLSNSQSKPTYMFVYLDMAAGNLLETINNQDFERDIPQLLYKTMQNLDSNSYEAVTLDKMFGMID